MEGQTAFLKYVKEFVTSLSAEVIPAVMAELKSNGAEIKQDAQTAWNEFKEKIEKTQSENFTYTELEMLEREKLLSMATENIVEGADEVYAWKKSENDCVIVSLAYGKDG